MTSQSTAPATVSVISIRGDGHCVFYIALLTTVLLVVPSFLTTCKGFAVCLPILGERMRDHMLEAFKKWCSAQSPESLHEVVVSIWGCTVDEWLAQHSSRGHGYLQDLAMFLAPYGIGVVLADSRRPQTVLERHVVSFLKRPPRYILCVVRTDEHFDLVAMRWVHPTGQVEYRALFEMASWNCEQKKVHAFFTKPEVVGRVCGSRLWVVPPPAGTWRSRMYVIHTLF